MKHSVKKNYIYNLIYQILAIIFPIITTPYIARVLGASGTGIYGYTTSISAYFVLLGTVGLSLYGQREMAYIQNDTEKRNKLFTELTIIRFITMGLSIISFFFLFCLNGEYKIYYQILILELIAQAIDISWVYQGIEEFKIIVLRNIIIKLISVVCIFLFIRNANDIWVYVAIYGFSIFVGNVSLWFKKSKYVQFTTIVMSNLKKHVKPVICFFIPQIAIQVYTIFDKTMVGIISNDMNQVGYYEQAQKVIKLLLTIITSLTTVMMPRIANCYAEGKSEQVKEYIFKSFKFLYFLAFPMMFGIIAISRNFVPIFFGQGYDSVISILSIMSLIIVFIGISTIIGSQILLATKKEKKYTISVIIGACINFILNIILITNFQALGATIATVVAELSVALVQLFYIRKEFNLKMILKNCWKYLLSSIIMFILCISINFLELSTINKLVIQILIGLCSYLGILLILKDDFLNCILDFIKNRLLKLNNKKKKEIK